DDRAGYRAAHLDAGIAARDQPAGRVGDRSAAPQVERLGVDIAAENRTGVVNRAVPVIADDQAVPDPGDQPARRVRERTVARHLDADAVGTGGRDRAVIANAAVRHRDAEIDRADQRRRRAGSAVDDYAARLQHHPGAARPGPGNRSQIG